MIKGRVIKYKNKFIIVPVAVCLAVGLAGCADRDSYMSNLQKIEDTITGEKTGMNMEGKSYAEIAEVLKEFGISGISDETIKELEESYAQLPPDVMFSKTATLLSFAGRGDMNYDTMEWTPSKNGVYSFDVEVFRNDTMYADFLLGISAIGGDELVFQNIKEDTSEVNWREGTGKRSVSFEWNGNTYVLEAEMMHDWFDLEVADALNQIIISNGNGKKLYFASDGYQECIVFYCDEDWAKEFEDKTGLDLSDSI